VKLITYVARFKNKWYCTSILPYVTMLWWIPQYISNFCEIIMIIFLIS
jgi:hypothetical protein